MAKVDRRAVVPASAQMQAFSSELVPLGMPSTLGGALSAQGTLVGRLCATTTRCTRLTMVLICQILGRPLSENGMRFQAGKLQPCVMIESGEKGGPARGIFNILA